MKTERRGLARGLRFVFDAILLLGGAAWLVFAFMLLASPVTGHPDEGWSVNLPVAIGQGKVFPVLGLDPAVGATGEASHLRVVDGRGELRFRSEDMAVHFVANGTLVVGLAVVLWVFFLLRGILATAAEGNPFHPGNARALNTIGWILVATGLLVPLVENLAGRWALQRIQVTELVFPPPLTAASDAFLGGLIVLVLASIWKQAAEMAVEQSLTV